MAVQDILKRVRSKAIDARKSAHQLAIDVVAGKKVSDENIEAACRNAGLSFEHFADLCEKLSGRKAAFEAFAANDFEGQLAKLRSEYAQATADEDALRAEITVLTEQLKTLAGNNRAAGLHIGRVEQQAREAKEAFAKQFGDAESWHDEPKPRQPQYRTASGEPVNVGWGPELSTTPAVESTGTDASVQWGPATNVGLPRGGV